MKLPSNHKAFCIFLLLAGILALWSCNHLGNKNKLKGKTYQVLLVGDMNNIVYNALNAPTPGLSQYEPLVDVIKSKTSAFDKYMYRTIIQVKQEKTIKDKGGINISVSDTEDITGPYFVNIAFANKKSLIQALPFIQNLVIKLEIIREQKRLIKEHNPKAELLVRKLFHKQMLIPKELTFSKKGKDFIWLSNNASEGMVNICLYMADVSNFKAERDRILKKGIPGERANMYMTTDTILSSINSKTGSTTIRGLWKMKGEAMAGPFIAYAPANNIKGKRTLIAEAFIFAPERNKRNLIRKAEASLYTLNIKYNNP